MDVNKAITNPNLVNIIREIKQGKNKEELFWKEVFKAKFLCPIEMSSATKREYSKLVLDEGAQISLLSIDDKNNETFLMAFTDWNEIKKGEQIEGKQTLVLTYEDYRKIIIKNHSPYKGMVINPFGENVVLSKQLLADTRENERIIQKGESVMLGLPREYPIDMVNKLKEYFVFTQNVDKAYLLWMVRDKESSYLLVLDTEVSPRQLFPIIGQICQPFLNGKLLDIILANSSLGKNVVEEHFPFFTKQ